MIGIKMSFVRVSMILPCGSFDHRPNFAAPQN